MSEQVYDWQRFWHPLGVVPVLSDEGFLLDPTIPWGATRNSSLPTFDTLTDAPCLILLGEPGIGKSRSIEAERTRIEAEARANDDEVLTVDLRSIASDTHLFRKIFDAPKFRAWAEADGDTRPRLHLFLDSLDECLLRVTTLAQILLDEFTQFPTDRLSLRIACRTAVWTGSLGFFEDGLRKIWGRDAVTVVALAPLRRGDVIHAAERNGIDEPESFVQAVRRAGAQAFAIKPVTLDLLLRIFKEEKNLSGSLAEIYRHGCRLLCEETNQSRRASGGKGILSVDQRLAVAARIAAVTVFANRYAVFPQPDQGEMTNADVAISLLIGGVEKDQLGTPFSVTEAALSEALDTGLFSGRDSDRMGWAHQTYAEYLAAWYVTGLHQLEGERLLSLLIHPGDDDQRLAPQLRSVAPWIAPNCAEVVRHVAKSDPDVLLAGDTNLDQATQARIIDRLLEMVADNIIAVGNLPIGDSLKRLDHAGLPDQLRPYISDNTKDLSVRHAAIDIGEGCGRNELQDEWIHIALDQTEPLSLRIQAAYAVARVGDSQACHQMFPLAQGIAGDDPADELKGCGLKAVWPEHITVAQLILLLTPPKRPHYFGAYQGFLRTLKLEQVPDVDLPPALQWAGEQRTPHDATNFREPVVLEIIAQGWERIDSPGVLDALADAAFVRVNAHEPVFGADIYGRVTPPDMADEAKRHALVEALMFRAGNAVTVDSTGDRAVLLIANQGAALFRTDDLDWLLGCLRNLTTGTTLAQAYARLIWYLFRWCENAPEQLEAVYQAREWSPELKAEYAHVFDPVDPNSDAARRMREYHAFEQEASERNKPFQVDPAPGERIQKHLQDFERGDNIGWLWLCRASQLKPDSRYYELDLEPDLTVLPGWAAADSILQDRIVNAAEEYLKRQSPEDQDWEGWDEAYPPASILAGGYRALLLLLRANVEKFSSLSTEVWERWAPVLPFFPLTTSGPTWELHRVLTMLTYQKAPDQLIASLLRLADKDSVNGHSLAGLNAFRDCMDERLCAALFTKLENPALSAAVTGTILDDLFIYAQGEVPSVAQTVAERLLGTLLTTPVSSNRKTADKALVVAVSLVRGASNSAWDSVWAAVQNNTRFGRRLFETIAYQDRRSDHLFTVLNEQQLADLYLWLTTQYPHDRDPKLDGFHKVEPRESVAQWRDNLLNHLAARGTVEACEAIERLVTLLSHLKWLPHMLQQARDAMRRNTWEPPTPEQVILLATESDLYLVRTEAELLSAVVTSLGRLQKRLQDETPAAFDLWSEIPGEEKKPDPGSNTDSTTATDTEEGTKKQRRKAPPKRYRPKSENALSDYVKRHLEMDMKGRGVVLGREVEIRAGTDGGAAGEITDIHVDAVVARADGREDAPRDVVNVIIESKGAWNSELNTAMEEQLVNRYLRENRCRHGIYLVGWFRCEQWDSDDWRRGKHAGGTLADLRERLEKQAEDVAQRSGMSVVAIVLDSSLR